MRESSNQKLDTFKTPAMNVTGSQAQDPDQGQKLLKHKHSRPAASPPSSSWLSLPPPIKQIFDRFPLTTYDENDLPQRVSRARNHHTLHVFTLGDEQLSPNPVCLKWQAYLLTNNIPFSIISANNHASPTGALPFILPAQTSKKDPQPQPIAASKIQRWAETQGVEEEQSDIKLEAYLSLIDQNIRNAWLYHLYLQEQNFEHVARKMYVEKASSNTLVQATLARQLQAAARDQLLKTRSFIDAEEIYDLADAAFKSLATILDRNLFYSRRDFPNLFDVTLFSYTHLLLDLAGGEHKEQLMWRDDRLVQILLQYERLVEHRKRVLDFCLR